MKDDTRIEVVLPSPLVSCVRVGQGSRYVRLCEYGDVLHRPLVDVSVEAPAHGQNLFVMLTSTQVATTCRPLSIVHTLLSGQRKTFAFVIQGLT